MPVRTTHRPNPLSASTIALTVGMGLVVGVVGLAPAATAETAAAAAPAAGAQLAPTGRHVTGPDPIEAGPLDTAAGEACDFPVHVQPLIDREFVYSYYDGSGRLTDQLFYGTLVDRIVNTDTGASAVVDVSGTALYSYGVDESLTIYGVGPYLAVFREGDVPGPSIRRISGASKLVIRPDGTKRLVYAATSEDLCERID